MAMRGNGSAFFEAVDVSLKFQFLRQSSGAREVDGNQSLAVVRQFHPFADAIKVNRTKKVLEFNAREYLCNLLLPLGLLRPLILHRPADLFHFSQPASCQTVN